MRVYNLLTIIILLAACHNPQPVPPPVPDASDAAPNGLQDALPPPNECQAACEVLNGLECPEGAQVDCAQTMWTVDSTRLIRTPSGNALTCAAVASCRTVMNVRALGIQCPQLN